MDESIPVLEIELQRIEMRTPKPQMTQKQQQNGCPEHTTEQEQVNNGVAGVNLESPEVD